MWAKLGMGVNKVLGRGQHSAVAAKDTGAWLLSQLLDWPDTFLLAQIGQ